MDSNVSFVGEAALPTTSPRIIEKGISGTLMRTGLVKNASQANALLLIISLAILALAGFLFMRAFPEAEVTTPQDIERFEAMKNWTRP